MGPEIRRVSVELLRHGPRHNQLLSPLTPYLAVCGDFPGGVVHAPYEQAEVQNGDGTLTSSPLSRRSYRDLIGD